MLFRHAAGNVALSSEDDIAQKLALGEHVRDETLALISLAKYRYLRRTYNAPELRADPFAVAEEGKGK